MSDQEPPDPTPPSYGEPPPPMPPAGQPWPPQQQQWQQQGYGYGVAPESKTLGLAIAALVCGVVGLLVFAIVLGPLALIFGLQARRKIKESNGALKGDGLALAGVILGPVDVVLWLLIISTL